VVANADAVASLDVPDPSKVAYLTQTTLSVDDTRDIIEALRKKFPRIVGPRGTTSATPRRTGQAAVKGWPATWTWSSSSARRTAPRHPARGVSRTAGTRAYLINDVNDIQPEWLAARLASA